MTVLPDLLVEFPGPDPISGDLCLLSMFLRQDFFGGPSRQVFEALDEPRVPSRLLLQSVRAVPPPAKSHSIPSRFVSLSSMNSIGSAHADGFGALHVLAREHSR